MSLAGVIVIKPAMTALAIYRRIISTMENLISSMMTACNAGNYYVALFTALTLPDICGRIEFPRTNGSQDRYIKWTETFLHKLPGIGASYAKLMPASDMYALRCAVLHEGRSTVSDQHRAKKLLDYYIFISGSDTHLNLFDNFNGNNKVFLQVSVDRFCAELKQAVTNWQQSISNDSSKVATLSETIEIHPASYTYEGVTFA